MKILVCTMEYPPKYCSGLGYAVYYVVEELKKKGWECTVVAPVCGDKELGFSWMIRKFGGIGLLLFWNRAAKLINRDWKKYDLVWVHNPLIRRKVKAKNVYATFQTTFQKYYDLYKNTSMSYYKKVYFKVMQMLERPCFSKNKFRTSCVSDAVRAEVEERGWKTVYVPNGVDATKFKPVHKKDMKEITLVYTGRYDYQKNLPKLIQTMAEVKKLDSRIKLKMIGDGELWDVVKTEIKKRGAFNVEMAGRVPHDELAKMYQKVHFFIIASVYEGQPLTLIEAMGAGLPPITSDISNHTQVLKDAGVGKYLSFNDPKKAAKIIVDYINKVPYEKESKKTAEFVRKHMNWKTVTERYIKAWKIRTSKT